MAHRGNIKHRIKPANLASVGSRAPCATRRFASSRQAVENALRSFLTDANELRSGCAKTGNRMIVIRRQRRARREVKRTKPPRRRRDDRPADLPRLIRLSVSSSGVGRKRIKNRQTAAARLQTGFAKLARNPQGPARRSIATRSSRSPPMAAERASRTSGRSTCVRPGMTWLRRNSRKLASS